jgi:D-alanyl-D-alanine carboxypeptidase
MLKAISGVALGAPLASGLLRTAPAAAQVTAPSARRLTGTAGDLQALLAAEIKAGMTGSYAQVRVGGATYELAAGVADVSTGAPPVAGSHHRIGGATKTFTAVTVLHLVGEHLIDLDAPISRYLPDVVPGDRGRQITVRMLLNQTSGIADFAVIAYPDSPDNSMLFTTPQSIAYTATRTYRPVDLVRMGLNRPPVAAPGAMWSYSNTNYVILGLLIERVTGRTYEEEVTRRVLLPAGLLNSYLPGASRGILGPRMKAYVPWTGGGLRDFTNYNMSYAWGALDLISTAEDMNRFYRELLGGRVLPPALLQEMKTTVPMSAAFPSAAGYGLGIYWVLSRSGRMWGHGGLAIGHTFFSFHTEDGHTMQMTQLENLNFYESLAQYSQVIPTQPIDIARTQFQSAVESLAGAPASGTTASTASTAARISRLPGVLPAAVSRWQ